MRSLITLAKRSAAVACLLACVVAPGVSSANAPGHGERPVGVALDPLLRLTSQKGHRLVKADLRGRPMVVVFGYTNCADVCPTALFELSLHLKQLGRDGDRLRVLFVTVDPERDTVEQLDAYLESFDPRIIGLTGSPAEVAAVAAAFSAPFRSDEQRETAFVHSSSIFLIDKFGLLARRVGYQETDALAAVSKRLLAQ
jgi:protein SCO1